MVRITVIIKNIFKFLATDENNDKVTFISDNNWEFYTFSSITLTLLVFIIKQ